MQLSFGGFYNFFTIYESEIGISLDMIRWMWIFGVICEIVMLYFQGPLLQKNLLQVIKITTLITALRWFMLYLFGQNVSMVFLSQSLHAFSFALYHTAVISYLFLLYSQKILAQQFYLGISFGLGGSLGALLAGKLYGDNLFLYEIHSPLAGLISIFETLDVDSVFILSVDVPFVDKAIIEVIKNQAQKSSDYDALIALSPSGLEPLCGVYRRSILPLAKELFSKDIHKLNHLLKLSKMKEIAFEEQDKFLNLNTPQDYEMARSL
ncbi:MAG: MFS transporter, partial [Sulfurovaceae bacterium]